jgi:hypothetical protein
MANKMKVAYLLVDYFNIFPSGYNQSSNYKDHLSDIEEFVDKIVLWNESELYNFDELDIRLYGGWSDNEMGEYTQIRQVTGAITRKHFPTKSKGTRVKITHEDSSCSIPGVVFPLTKREIPIFRSVKIRNNCPTSDINCPIHIIKTLKSGKCPNFNKCGTITDDLFYTVNQKLVDTSLVADCLIFASNTFDYAFPVSNDDDIVIAALAGRSFSPKVGMLFYKREKECIYNAILDNYKIYHHNIA